MPIAYQPIPNPYPTPYQSPSQGGNQYVKPGTTGVSIPQNIAPVYGPQQYGQTEWNNGMITGSGGGTLYKAPTQQVLGASTSQQSPPPAQQNINNPPPPATNNPEKLPGWNQRGDFTGQEVGSEGNIYKWTGNGWEYLRPEGPSVPSGPSDQDLNSAYDPIFNYLNQAEQTLGSSNQNQLGLLDKQASTNRQALQNEQQKAQGTIGTQKLEAGQRREDVINSARRMFNELSQANTQRFGGASSAGQAASELQAIEFQRNRANTEKAFEATAREIGAREVEVNSQYSLQLQQLQDKVDSAKLQSFNDFQNSLLQIAGDRAKTASEKAQRKLQYLDQYRQQLFQVQLAEQKQKQALEVWKQQQDYLLGVYKQQLAMQTQAAKQSNSSFLSNTTLNPTSANVPGSTSKSQMPSYIGAYKNDEMLQGYAPGIYDQNNQQIGSSTQTLRAY